MSLFNKLILKILGTKGQKIHSQFGDVIVSTTKEFNFLSAHPVKDLMLTWLVSFPWAYFETLFIKNSAWNSHVAEFFDKSKLENGKECALLSQAFGGR